LDFYNGYIIYAIPKAKPAPKEYTVQESAFGTFHFVKLPDFKPGDRVTVQRVEK
jgi:hypothetical protein